MKANKLSLKIIVRMIANIAKNILLLLRTCPPNVLNVSIYYDKPSNLSFACLNLINKANERKSAPLLKNRLNPEGVSLNEILINSSEQIAREFNKLLSRILLQFALEALTVQA
ncbi:hypothetical protein D3C87_1457980 [compost metagenome]